MARLGCLDAWEMSGQARIDGGFTFQNFIQDTSALGIRQQGTLQGANRPTPVGLCQFGGAGQYAAQGANAAQRIFVKRLRILNKLLSPQMREYRLKFLQAGSEGHYIFGVVLPVTLAVHCVFRAIVTGDFAEA